MLARNDQPEGSGLDFATDSNFSFAVDSVFVSPGNQHSSSLPPADNLFLLLDGSDFLLLDGTNLLLLGT